MRVHTLTAGEWLKAIGIGIGTAILLSAVMVPALRFGISPLPKPLGLAFAETILGRQLPLPVGLLFHVVYVTFWSVAFVVLFRNRLSLRNALLLGLVLWGTLPPGIQVAASGSIPELKTMARAPEGAMATKAA